MCENVISFGGVRLLLEACALLASSWLCLFISTDVNAAEIVWCTHDLLQLGHLVAHHDDRLLASSMHDECLYIDCCSLKCVLFVVLQPRDHG